ncbi:MAG: hypothetical protein RMI94_01695 [Bryobacterales bacterium]|nr:hypothetical protein [Bryobacteraceae bacterium]MDW8129233.1 hypothetical protein [Bryobacterales bacterium]
MKVLRFVSIPLTACMVSAGGEFRVRESRVEVLAQGEVVLTSPPEGLWTVACEWRDGWPANWVHAAPGETLREGPWTILRGHFEACGGWWRAEDAWRQVGRLVEVRRRLSREGTQAADRVTVAIRFQAAASRAQAVLPGILYYGNPSGARSGRVPVATGAPGEELLFEEHRYPMPFAALELDREGKLWGAALHSVPSPAPFANRQDQWWSLGVVYRQGGAELALWSGPCASNGRRSVIKALQAGFVPYDETWLRVPPGGVIEKTFFLETFPLEREGTVFQPPVRTSLELFRPYYAEDFPSVAEIVRAKYRYARTRWRRSERYAVFQKYADRRQAVMGWTGQAEAPGYALLVLAERLADPEAEHMAQASLDFLSTAPFYRDGFHNWYDLDSGRWHGEELLNQGQAMLAFARAIRVGRRRGRDVSRWEAFLRKACDLHAARILAASWRPPSTAEATFVPPLLIASQLFGEQRYRRAAIKAAEHYAQRHLSMREPYWGGTLDARSEDKEAAAAAFQAFLELYEHTRDPRHLQWARHACDVMLTYTYVWDVPMPPGRLASHRLRTRGWTSVSPQNQHLDVWGVLTAPDVYRLGEILGREELKRLALVMYRSCGQLIDPYGSQGEQLEQTNYTQARREVDPARLRGDYNERWTVFWITAHFLTGAARFLELGVPVWDGSDR